MSTHSVTVIEIETVLPHTNAERLEIIPVGGWQAVVKKGQFKPGDKAVYVQPDYTVPTSRPEFAFLAKDGKERHRLKAVRLRGALSFGLLLPVPDEIADADVGANVMDALGIERYEPPVKAFRGCDDGQELPESEWPNVYAPKFDVENIQNFPNVLRQGELVCVTEKIHGASSKYLWHDSQIFIGSRNRWLKPDADNIWSRALTPEMRAWCEAHPDTTLFGEVFGPVQSLKYGMAEPEFRGFAALHKDQWLDLPTLFRSLESFDAPHVPELFIGPFDFEAIKEMAEWDSRVCETPHMMEGVVITPVVERHDPEIGRVCLKLISNRYWMADA